MSDLIKRSDAIDELMHIIPYKRYHNGEYVFLLNKRECLKAIKAIPSADRPQEDDVSRRYLLAEIDDLADEFSEVDENGLHSERWCGIMDSKLIIVNAPSVPDRPQGKWVNVKISISGDSSAECSLCGAVVHNNFSNVINYCPNCGADMRAQGE